MTLTDQLAQWRESLVRLGAPVAPVLKPGRSRPEIEAVLGATAPRAVLEWFLWCDGVEYAPGQTIGDSWAIPGFWPVELQDVTGIRADCHDEGSPLLAGNWVPLLQNGSSDLYVAAWSDTSEPAVVTIMPEFAPPEVEFQSVEQMVTVFNECFARSAYYLNAERQLDVDEELYDEIYAAVVGPRPTGCW
ncbi:SMI1/KNR4 family protein [Micromonospora sp. HK10]|uniref:SMI1/KNR4 family protein n=1 Tax=Micromonospora sp. HK10 TaxID=1538294 RepID=UPI0012E2BEC3|nr:SMI1/KNR4 family protein [Micromonospora sp. HK10]